MQQTTTEKHLWYTLETRNEIRFTIGFDFNWTNLDYHVTNVKTQDHVDVHHVTLTYQRSR